MIDAPDLLPLLDGRSYLAVPADAAGALADLLDVDLVSEAISGAVTSEGEPRPVPDAIRELLPECPDTYIEHDELILDDGVEVVVAGDRRRAARLDVRRHGRALAWVAGDAGTADTSSRRCWSSRSSAERTGRGDVLRVADYE